MQAPATETNPSPGDSFLRVRPLGGAGVMGMNCTVYETEGVALVVDCGIGYTTGAHPGAEALLPDLDFLERLGPRLVGYVITHGHDDHIGALPFALRTAPAPVFAPPYAARLIEAKLQGNDCAAMPPVRPLTPASLLRLGPFELSFVRVAHSTPDCLAVVLAGPWGRVVHTGDWKMDRGLADGFAFDEAAFQELGQRGVDLLLSDSTNAAAPGWTRSEADVHKALETCVRQWGGRVVVAVFASNVHRIEALRAVARRTGRRLCVLGRAMRRHLHASRASGLSAPRLEELLPAEELLSHPPERTLVACTGSQAERGSVLPEAARGEHRFLAVGPGDLVVLSARTIPGNAREVADMIDALLRRGARVVTPSNDTPVHASGHARADELELLFHLLRPKAFVPIHGNRAMLEAHAALARRCGIAQVEVIENGQSIELSGGTLRRGAASDVRTWVLDGLATYPGDAEVLTERRRAGAHGVVVATVHAGPDGAPARIGLRAVGLALDETTAAACADEALQAPAAFDEAQIERAVARAVARRTGKRPVVVVTYVPAGDASQAPTGEPVRP